MQLPIIHMTEGNVVCRVPPNLQGKRVSVVSLGLCNFRCKYCYLGGGIKRHGLVFPNAIPVETSEIEDFIRSQIKKGNLIKISGGEPTLSMEATLHLVKIVKSSGGYICVDSSGWDPDACSILAKVVNQLALDLKASPRYIQRLTGVSLELCWHKPIESLRRVANIVPVLEVRTPVFGFTRIQDLQEICHHIPKNAFWVIRRFISHWVPFDKYSRNGYPGLGRPEVKYPAWLTSPPMKLLDVWAEELLQYDPTLENRLVLLKESPRDDGGTLRSNYNLNEVKTDS